jgi:hypothetical protein
MSSDRVGDEDEVASLIAGVVRLRSPAPAVQPRGLATILAGVAGGDAGRHQVSREAVTRDGRLTDDGSRPPRPATRGKRAMGLMFRRRRPLMRVHQCGAPTDDEFAAANAKLVGI